MARSSYCHADAGSERTEIPPGERMLWPPSAWWCRCRVIRGFVPGPSNGSECHRHRRACSRDTVREVRYGARQSDAAKPPSYPLWMLQLEWPAIVHDLRLGHPLKLIWEEKAQHLTTYSSFWKQFYRKRPQYRQAAVTAREFDPGERVEVDYAGDALEWLELKTGEIRKAYVFVAG